MAATTSIPPVNGELSDSEINDMSPEELVKLYETITTAVKAAEKSLDGLLERAESGSTEMDFTSGLSLLNLRPHLLVTSLHHLLLTLSLRLSTLSSSTSSTASTSNQILAPLPAFSNPTRPSRSIASSSSSSAEALPSLRSELFVSREAMEKVKGMEGKVSYQVGKLVGMAANEEKRVREAEERAKRVGNGKAKAEADDDEEEEDLLSFRPNAAALLSASSKADKASATAAASSRRRRGSVSDEEEEQDRSGVYKPPRVAAVPYVEGGKGKAGRKERKAPALLTEFASSLTSAPVLESTSGLSVRPVAPGTSSAFHSNSASANRLAELQRMNEFEEENMTRLVMTKREQKRREEDEAALALGFGVGGAARSRSRRQGGFEAEMEGVLGDRGYSKGMWDGVGKSLGKGEGMLKRSRKRDSGAMGDESEGRPRKTQKGRFDKAVGRTRR